MAVSILKKYKDIAVIITSYNYGNYIERCLRSILHQSIEESEYQIILIDDASDDSTGSILKNYTGTENLTIITNEKNIGLPASLNKAIRSYSSQFVVRIDADDFVDFKYLEYLRYFLLSNSIYDAVSCDYYTVSENEKRESRKSSIEEPIGCGIMFRRDVLVSLGLYNPDFLAREEEDLQQRFDAAGRKMLNIPAPLYRYRNHNEGITSNQAEMEKFKKKLDKDHER